MVSKSVFTAFAFIGGKSFVSLIPLRQPTSYIYLSLAAFLYTIGYILQFKSYSSCVSSCCRSPSNDCRNPLRLLQKVPVLHLLVLRHCRLSFVLRIKFPSPLILSYFPKAASPGFVQCHSLALSFISVSLYHELLCIPHVGHLIPDICLQRILAHNS